ncbi:unnamed protein product, partial [Ectocarpus sp. 12 AP-2014]
IQDQVRWNTTHGSAKGFRFHPATLRIAVYFQGIAGSAAYNMLRTIVHLPSPRRIRELRAKATPPRTGVLMDNIRKYGKLAAMQDADKADLYGVLAWDLMHLNKNGFSFSPNAGGISGLVDETSFFNPIYTDQGDMQQDLEKTLEGIVATQYVEVLHFSCSSSASAIRSTSSSCGAKPSAPSARTTSNAWCSPACAISPWHTETRGLTSSRRCAMVHP